MVTLSVPLRNAKFDPYSAQCNYFNVPHQLWLGTLTSINMVISEDTWLNMVISEDTWLSDLLPSVWLWSCHYLIERYVSRGRNLNIHHFCMQGEHSDRLRHSRCSFDTKKLFIIFSMKSDAKFEFVFLHNEVF